MTVHVCCLHMLFALPLLPLWSDVDVMAVDGGVPSEGYRRKERRKWDFQKISTGKGHPSSLVPDLAAVPATILGIPLPAIDLCLAVCLRVNGNGVLSDKVVLAGAAVGVAFGSEECKGEESDCFGCWGRGWCGSGCRGALGVVVAVAVSFVCEFSGGGRDWG
ncbi:hypothetical protein K439DRAFT_1623908 [Ramaria rubella]|nr:hypothetical protein K439DRAFT_1623908 [Ramaria rubella]